MDLLRNYAGNEYEPESNAKHLVSDHLFGFFLMDDWISESHMTRYSEKNSGHGGNINKDAKSSTRKLPENSSLFRASAVSRQSRHVRFEKKAVQAVGKTRL